MSEGFLSRFRGVIEVLEGLLLEFEGGVGGTSGVSFSGSGSVVSGDVVRSGGRFVDYVGRVVMVSPVGSDSGEGVEGDRVSLGRGLEILRSEGGGVLILGRGDYGVGIGLDFGGSSGLPLVLMSEEVGGARFGDVVEEVVGGEFVGGGIYGYGEGDPWCGWYSGGGRRVFLPRFGSLEDLEGVVRGDFRPLIGGRRLGMRLPRYGICSDGGRVYGSFPGGVERSGLRYGRSFGSVGIRVASGLDWVLFDGILFEGMGSGRGIDGEGSRVVVQNCEFRYCREGCRIGDGSILRGNRYGYPGFGDYAEGVARLSGGNLGKFFDYVKRYNSEGGNAFYEGRLATSGSIRSGRGVYFGFNVMEDCFDGQSMGQFSSSVSEGDYFRNCLDDGYEFESWRGVHDGRDLEVRGGVLVNCMSSFSHQDNVGQSRGPVRVEGAVVLNVGKYFTAPYIIKNMTSSRKLPKVRAEYVRCFFYNRSGINQWGRGVSFVYLDHKKGEWIDLSIRSSVIIVDEVDDWDRGWDADCDWNVLVSPRDYPHIRGENGLWFRDVGELHLSGRYWSEGILGVGFVESMFDVRPTSSSPHVGLGEGGVTSGPYEVGDDLRLDGRTHGLFRGYPGGI